MVRHLKQQQWWTIVSSKGVCVCAGLALGAHLGHTGVVSDRMLVAAAEAVPPLVTKDDLKMGAVYPTLDNIR